MIRPVASTVTPDEAAARRWSVIVIGAGPAGSTAAFVLARRGLDVLLVDRVALPRPKVCGCCLSARGVRALDRLGMSAALRGSAPLRSFRLRAGEREASVPLGGGVVIGRETLDGALAGGARDAGAALLSPAIARASADGLVRIEVAGKTVVARADAVIAADGLGGSSLRDVAEMRWRVARRSRIGAGASLASPPLALGEGEILMLWDRAGYIGFVRLPDGAVNAAAAWDPAAVRRCGGLAALAALVVEQAGGDPACVTGARWWGTPTLTRVRAAVEQSAIIATGDGAGYVEPFTGEGMTWAVLAGEAAALRVLSRRRGARTSWAGERRRLLWRDHAACALTAAALRSRACVRVAMGLGALAAQTGKVRGAIARGATP